jgi:hypothetical protein
MTDERDLSIRIKRTSNKHAGSILHDIFMGNEKFPADDECMFENDSWTSFKRLLKRNPIVEHGESDEEEGGDENYLTYSETLKPMMRDMTGALEQRGELKIERRERSNTVEWVVLIDNHRAKYLDRIFADFIGFLKRAFNAE